ncbi:MAG: hypothetical protein BM562_00350 [Alphaproteobacteria bacterium MedPE-SWcel]|nr:MAG: hypothetical protein BM562_00350 [Alphaproteobacteria bacterium MedPE-SWcel]
MKRGLKILVGTALVWTLYWVVAGWGLRQNVAAWFDAQAQLGWQVETRSIAPAAPLGGFPTHHRTRITAPALVDPATGAAWRADWLDIESPAIWPGRQVLRFADGQQRLSYFDRTAVITTEGLQAKLTLAPGLALEVEDMGLTAAAWSIGDGQTPTLGAADLSLRMVRQQSSQTYRITAEARDFRPGAELRRLLRSAPDLPQTFEVLTLAADVEFDTPWSRSALETRRPQPRRIDLERMELRWGEMRIKSTGQLDVDEAGIPTGALALQVEAWAAFLDLAVDTGLLSPGARNQASRVVAMLARASGNPEDLDITLGFRGGYITIGPIPLGPAPRLILR